MKKLLFAALCLSGLAFFAPSAEAGSYRTVFAGYDHCGRPVYRQVYVQSQCYSRPTYHSSYRAPVYYRSSSYSRSYDYGRSYNRNSRCSSSSSRPRLAISFGF